MCTFYKVHILYLTCIKIQEITSPTMNILYAVYRRFIAPLATHTLPLFTTQHVSINHHHPCHHFDTIIYISPPHLPRKFLLRDPDNNTFRPFTVVNNLPPP